MASERGRHWHRLGQLEAREAARREALARQWAWLTEEASMGLSPAEIDAVLDWDRRTDGEACKRELAELEAWQVARSGPFDEVPPDLHRWLTDVWENVGTPQPAPVGAAAHLAGTRDSWRAASEAPDCPQLRAARYAAGLWAFLHEHVRVLGEVLP